MATTGFMQGSRRSFFAALLSPIAARLLPAPEPKPWWREINEGITPGWDGKFTLKSLDALYHGATIGGYSQPDTIITTQRVFAYIKKRQELHMDPGAQWIGNGFVKPTGGKWQRVDGGLRYPEKAPRMPA